jgi:hypothetical protein
MISMTTRIKIGLRLGAVILLLSGLVFGVDQSVTWVPPDAYENGDPLLEQDLDFYTLYCNGQPYSTIDNVIGQNTALIDFGPLGEGTHECYLTVTALNGMESAPSNTANFTVGPRTPGAPTNFVIAL